mmetsp:Transcript_18617/g.21500  ORF Transcript_18617/g.21500 Transcript_18617/m.21500 type:complete len:369 (-) Transcript_18617:129-1235(-)
MFQRLDKDEDPNSLPSWLKDPDDTNQNAPTTNAPVPVQGTMSKNSSYGGQSSGGGSINSGAVEEYYGGSDSYHDLPTPPPPPHDDVEAFSGGLMPTSEETGTPDWAASDREEDDDDDDEDEDEDEEDSEEESSDESDSSNESSIESDAESTANEATHLISSKKKKHWAEESARKSKKSREQQQSEPEEMKTPRRNCCHSFFVLIEMITILCNLAMIGVQLIPIYFWEQHMKPEQEVIRFYVAFFCLIFILSEIELYKGLNNWIHRGVIYTFVGVISLNQRVDMLATGLLNKKGANVTLSETWDELWASIIIEVTSYWMIVLGCLYVLMGLLCMKSIRKRLVSDYQKRLEEFKETKPEKKYKKKRRADW